MNIRYPLYEGVYRILTFVRRESRQGGSYSDGYKNAYYERAGCYGDYSQEG